MASSKVSICNMALLHCGQPMISDITESPACATMYDTCLESVLSEHTWSFALYREVITNKTAVEWGEGYKFALPENTISVHRVYDYLDGGHNRPQVRDWRMENGYIVANVDTVYAHIVKKVGESRFPSYFASALAARLALDICVAVTQNNGIYATLADLYERKLSDAVTADGIQGTSEQYENGRLLRARY
jgi:hypothetical protein